MEIKLTSPAFNEGEMIPAEYTGDGLNLSPPLEWEGAPAGTKTFAIISDDPDAPMGTWVHWVAFNIPSHTNILEKGIPTQNLLMNGTHQGLNDSKKIGYSGPYPPSGVHRYYFRLYALDSELNLASGCTKQQLLHAMEGHILAEGQLMGRYRRPGH